MRSLIRLGSLFHSLGFLALLTSCSSSSGDPRHGTLSGAGGQVSVASGGGSGGVESNAPNTEGGKSGVIDLPSMLAGCGNGTLTEDEACDDGNAASGDGCAADCKAVELGWSCPAAGAACIRVARCGDGLPSFPELCDDGNAKAGDGCSPACKVEIGFKCAGTPSKCTPTKCGDGEQEGAESCEDGNTMPFDGCSSKCQAEPDCSGGSCISRCGDGLALNEECDDGNNVDGDGCSSSCKKEAGYSCAVPQPQGFMDVPVVFRDFQVAHPDFEPDGPNHTTPTFGMVASKLDADKKPVYQAVAESLVTNAQTFADWYRDVPSKNSTVVSSLTLWDAGSGRFVNRWGKDGKPWILLTGESEHYCGNVGNEVSGVPCTSSTEATPNCGDLSSAAFASCDVRAGVYWARFVKAAYDGNPLFFPIDTSSFTAQTERSIAQVSPPYGNWEAEKAHNFHFTSEIRYWFQYRAGEQYVLDFTGDDDVWVFINDRLAVDLGGIHSANNGHLVIDAMGNARTTYAATESNAVIPGRTVDLDLKSGNVYQIAVFHAERQTTVSTFKLTLQGFAMARSECKPTCGDGIVALGEQCDDGVNDGGYGECAPGCVLGEFCGDGITQLPEQCDDGNTLDGDDCGSGCRNLVVR